ncbi:MAG: hypothetical protein AB8I08_41045 [Sandaracinaceae bacterium]
MTPGSAILRGAHLVVQVFDGAHLESFADRLAAECKAAVRYPTRASVLIHLAPTAKAPDASARRQYIDFLRDHAERAFGFAFIVEGDGFTMAFQRSVLTGLNLLAVHDMPTHVTASLDAALSWFEEQGSPVEDRLRMRAMHAEAISALRRSALH